METLEPPEQRLRRRGELRALREEGQVHAGAAGPGHERGEQVPLRGGDRHHPVHHQEVEPGRLGRGGATDHRVGRGAERPGPVQRGEPGEPRLVRLERRRERLEPRRGGTLDGGRGGPQVARGDLAAPELSERGGERGGEPIPWVQRREGPAGVGARLGRQDALGQRREHRPSIPRGGQQPGHQPRERADGRAEEHPTLRVAQPARGAARRERRGHEAEDGHAPSIRGTADASGRQQLVTRSR